MNYDVYETYDDGTIRITMEPEVENYFSVYGEPDGYINGDGIEISASEEKKDIIDLIERDGLFTYQSEYLCPCCGSWKVADSIGMVIGDIEPTGYLPDLLDTARQQREEK